MKPPNQPTHHSHIQLHYSIVYRVQPLFVKMLSAAPVAAHDAAVITVDLSQSIWVCDVQQGVQTGRGGVSSWVTPWHTPRHPGPYLRAGGMSDLMAKLMLGIPPPASWQNRISFSYF